MPLPHFSLWTEAASLVFISGQLAFDATGRIPETEVFGQTTQVLRNLEAVAAKAGLKLSDVVKTTIWLRSQSDFAAFNESYANYHLCARPSGRPCGDRGNRSAVELTSGGLIVSRCC